MVIKKLSIYLENENRTAHLWVTEDGHVLSESFYGDALLQYVTLSMAASSIGAKNALIGIESAVHGHVHRTTNEVLN